MFSCFFLLFFKKLLTFGKYLVIITRDLKQTAGAEFTQPLPFVVVINGRDRGRVHGRDRRPGSALVALSLLFP